MLAEILYKGWLVLAGLATFFLLAFFAIIVLAVLL
jgi:hypothetical protein